MANPVFIPIQFALNGVKNPIQKELQVGQDLEDATWNNGWGTITMIPKEDGGLAPKGQDFNGVLYTMSDHLVHRQNGQQILFSQDVVTEFGGYATGSIIQSDDFTKHYRSLIDNNTFNPNTTSITGRWEIYAGQGSIPTASSTVAGVTKVLNVLNSTDSGSALSAAQGKVLKDVFDKFVAATATNGGMTVPLGTSGLSIILKWGLISTLEINTTRVVTFPIAFPTACLNVQITPYSLEFSNIIENMVALWSTPTRTQFTVRNTWVGDAEGGFKAGNAYWFAIGY